VLLIGVDCATDDSKVGVARGHGDDRFVTVEDVLVCGKEWSAAKRIASWIGDAGESALLAIDAPLGWPRSLGLALANHQAGDEIDVEANALFRRDTDRFIKQRLGKTPLDVGADRIARTAHAALRLLGDLRRLLSDPIPLAWSPNTPSRISAIEVYPAATLLSRDVRADGYKKPVNVDERREIIRDLAPELSIVAQRSSTVERNADALDAAICVLAAADFVRGLSTGPPAHAESARREGWIWTRLPVSSVV
jgi:hypothetical protein